jgi:hypothetical protein
MRMLVAVTLAIILGGATAASAQSNASLDTPYQVRVVPKLKKGDLINLTNTGALGNATLCAHVYAFDPAGQLAACCSCPLPPFSFRSLAVGADVFTGTKPPKAAVFKVIGAAVAGGTCNAAQPGALATGLGAWKGELQFLPSTLSAGELSGLITRCGIVQATPRTCAICGSQ